MADPKEKKLVKDQETIKPVGDTEEEGELTEKDLDHASGGLNPQPLPPLQHPTYLKIL